MRVAGTVRRFAVLAACGVVAGACGTGTSELLDPDSGGEGSVAADNRNAFSLPSTLLSTEERRDFEVGDSFFTQNWVTAPASTEARDGLGPLFNAQACASCHVRDGRAEPPTGPDDPSRGLLIRLSVPGADAGEPPFPEPSYGGQLQDRGIVGVEPEAILEITHREVVGSYPDGTPYTLSEPRYDFSSLAYGAIDPAALASPRIAQQIIGVGLLEAVPEESIIAGADPDDSDGDGISGRPNWLASASGAMVLGRFGWKANVASVADQVAGAFAGDIGITSASHPEEDCPEDAAACLGAPNGGTPEIDGARMDRVVFYARTLAVPVRRNLEDPAVIAGSRHFADLGCTACHTATLTTGGDEVEALSNQVIHPFTDLLLHDMGPALADGRPDHSATGSEWRTPPLWGIGLVEVVNGHTSFLHDGRARTIEEAILWHGGEAELAQAGFKALTAAERAEVIAFLESL